MALSITDLKKGVIFQLNNEPFQVVDYSQKVMGRGGSIVNVRVKSLIDGKVLDKTFKGNEQLESADVTNQNAQYLYADDPNAYFMAEDTYEQFAVTKDILGDSIGYLKEGDKVIAQLLEDRIISVEIPKKVALQVTYTESAVRGDTSSSVMKDAVLETGVTVRVPIFIKQGDIIKVDTRNGTYLERSKD
jgi:elongation factor P